MFFTIVDTTTICVCDCCYWFLVGLWLFVVFFNAKLGDEQPINETGHFFTVVYSVCIVNVQYVVSLIFCFMFFNCFL